MAIRRYLPLASLLTALLAGLPAVAPAKTAAAKSKQTITFKSSAPSPATVGGTYKVEASASSGLAVSFSSGAPSVCSVSGSTVTFASAGTCIVDANQSGNESFEAAPQAQQSFAVVKKTQTITFKSSPPSPANVGGTYKGEASSSSGLAVSFSSGAPSVCSVSGSTVTFVSAGTCVLDANQSGNESFEAAPQAQQSFAVVKRKQTITFKSTAPSPGLAGSTYKAEVAASSGLPVNLSAATPSVCSVSGSSVSLKTEGTCTLDANQSGNGEWEAAPQAAQSFGVVKQKQTITFNSTPPSPAFVGGTYKAEATASSALAVSFSSATASVCSVSGASVSLKTEGTCTIDANQAGNAEWEAAPQVAQSFAVVKRPQSIAFESTPPKPAFVGGTYTVKVSASSGLGVSLGEATPTVCSVSGTTVSLKAPGTCTVAAGQEGNGEYSAAKAESQSFGVEKRVQTIKFESTPPTPALVGANYSVKASASSGLAVGISSATETVCTVAGLTVTFHAAGTCTINASQAGNGEWEPAPPQTQSFTVTKSTQTIAFTSTAPGGATIKGPTYTVTATGGASGNPVTFTIDAASASVCTISGATVSFTGAGTCTIDANQAGNEAYEAAPQTQQSFTVNRIAQTIKFTSVLPKSAAVGGTYSATAEASSGLAVSFSSATPAVCTVSGSTVTFLHTGTCTIDANQAGNAEYLPAAQVAQSFQINKGSQTIEFTSSAPGATVNGPTYTVAAKGGNSGNPVVLTIETASKSVCKISGSTVEFIGAGTCAIDANQAGSEDYEAAATITQSFAVHQLSQTISFKSSQPSSALVGGAYTVEASASSGLAVSFFAPTSSVCTISGSTVSFIAAGICTIDANQGGNGEYSPAAQVEQSFLVVAPSPPAGEGSGSPGPIVPVKPVTLPNSSFKAVGASLSLTTYAITFVESVVDPGTFTWTLWFDNGKFGAYAARVKPCKTGSVRLKGRCRPARILFGRGSETVTTAGSVTFTVKPTRSGVLALRKAFKQNKGLPVSADVTFQSVHGGPPVSRVQSLIVKGRR